MRDVPESDGCHADSEGSGDDMIREVSSGVTKRELDEDVVIQFLQDISRSRDGLDVCTLTARPPPFAFPQAPATTASNPIQFNLSTASGPFELIVTRVKRKSYLRDRTRSRPELDPLLPVLLARIRRRHWREVRFVHSSPNYPQKKQNPCEGVRRVFTSPSPGQSTIEGQKEGYGQTRLSLSTCHFYFR
ncbi:hypothetical protein N431DRAFT_46748 [Stipitochalara longipes BDJ]|nr:hypothetical protein N431DRAFT_46748 [Stipitochalara longipes BDJ]